MLLRLILGAVYLGMAIGQLISWRQMPEILSAYGALPVTWLPWLAAALIVGELVAGVWFLARPRSQALSPVWVYAVVSVVWAALGAQAWLRGLPVDNCGCFGLYLTQRLSWFVLAQDALLLGYAALMFRSGLRARAERGTMSGERPEADAAGAGDAGASGTADGATSGTASDTAGDPELLPERARPAESPA